MVIDNIRRINMGNGTDVLNLTNATVTGIDDPQPSGILEANSGGVALDRSKIATLADRIQLGGTDGGHKYDRSCRW